MAYFIHNKYDKASIDALAALDTTTNTVVDYYGDYETYKYLDTSAGFGILYDALSYVTPGAEIHDGQSDKDNSHFNFQSSIVIKSIQRGTCSLTTSSSITIPISKIDATKSVVLLNSGGNSSAGGDRCCLESISNTSIIVKKAVNASGVINASYQVIEFC